MIEILGVLDGKEYEAARHIRSKMLAVWPDLSQSRTDHVKIFVGLKLYGYRVEDIDIVIIGHFARPRSFAVEYQFYPKDGDPFIPKSAAIKNFILVIETKSHDATGVRFTDKTASVRYVRSGRETWEAVTEKNRLQMFEFKSYLERHGITRVYTQDLIFFSGLRENDLPKRPHNCFGLDASFERILNMLGQIANAHYDGRDVLLSFGADTTFEKLLSPEFPLLQTIEPTPIDRARMDRIVRSAVPDTWLGDLGNKQVMIRGRGGVGKTVILLQMAYRNFDQTGARSLVLTYNKALVADMRRTMALLGVPRSVERGGISIDTVHAFIGRLMHGLGIITTYNGFLEHYETAKQALLDYLKSGAVSQADLEALMTRDGESFLWDAVFVDEGQDWPTSEISILQAVYGPERLVIADGVDQFVRNSVANWSSGLSRDRIRPHRLRRCLRMKSNLTRFVSDLAEEFSLVDWDLDPNNEAAGGRVLIVEGDLAKDTTLYARLAAEALALGNHPIDLLACVPPILVGEVNGETVSVPAAALRAAGYNVWDGTSIDVRDYFPTDKSALRIVQYDSCRGLEGWTVINYAFDELWDYKYSQRKALPRGIGELFDAPDELAAQHAARWAMIPLTRAMDTIVINVSSKQSPLKSSLKRVHERRSDFVQWIAF